MAQAQFEAERAQVDDVVRRIEEEDRAEAEFKKRRQAETQVNNPPPL